MPETPDFNEVAKRIVRAAPGVDLVRAQLETAIWAELTNMWNARGAADIAAIDLALAAAMGGSDAAGPYIKHLDQALRTLDR